jgi:hypothetical protein
LLFGAWILTEGLPSVSFGIVYVPFNIGPIAYFYFQPFVYYSTTLTNGIRPGDISR